MSWEEKVEMMNSSSNRKADQDVVRPFNFEKAPKGSREKQREVKERDSVFQQARDQGFKVGEQAGFQAGRAKAQELEQHFVQIIQSLENMRETLYSNIEEDIFDLIFRIAEKVIQSEIRQDDASRMSVLSAGLKKLKEQEKIDVRVAASDFELIQEALPELCERNRVAGKVSLQADPDILPGGCILESDQCELDARIDKALQMIEESLKSL